MRKGARESQRQVVFISTKPESPAIGKAQLMCGIGRIYKIHTLREAEAEHGEFPTVATLHWSCTDVGGFFSLNHRQNSSDTSLLLPLPLLPNPRNHILCQMPLH